MCLTPTLALCKPQNIFEKQVDMVGSTVGHMSPVPQQQANDAKRVSSGGLTGLVETLKPSLVGEV